MSKKINIFLPPVINTDEHDEEFVDENYFVCELPFPFDLDWYADDEEICKYIKQHFNEIAKHIPIWYRDRILSISMRDIYIKDNKTVDKERNVWFIADTNEE